MPRPKRSLPGGYSYNVLSRRNARQTVFHKDEDYAAFLPLFDGGKMGISCSVEKLAWSEDYYVERQGL
jgi:hypothetical protein